MVSLTIRSSGTIIVPIIVPLTLALGPNLNKPLSISKTFLFWGFELLGGAAGAMIGSIFGYGEAGFILGLMAGGLAYIAAHKHIPPDPE